MTDEQRLQMVTDQLILVRDNLFRGMSKSIQKLQARSINEVLGLENFIRSSQPAPVQEPDWKAEYLKSVESGCITLDELREACVELEAAKQALAAPVQEPVLWMMPDGKTADKWALQFYGKQKGKPLYTTPPQRKPSHKEFMEWAGKEGYDTAYTINSDNGKFIALSPMTADLWKAWQAAHGITAAPEKGKP